jgi:hypothetical protein
MATIQHIKEWANKEEGRRWGECKDKSGNKQKKKQPSEISKKNSTFFPQQMKLNGTIGSRM